MTASVLLLVPSIISLYYLVIVRQKRRKGRKLSKFDRVVGIIGIISGIAATIQFFLLPEMRGIQIPPILIAAWGVSGAVIVFDVYVTIHFTTKWHRKRGRARAVELFEPEILNKKTFQLGETLSFHVRFKGKLKHGFLDAHIMPPGQEDVWMPAFIQDRNPRTPGDLDDKVDIDHTWTWQIPPGFPTGTYSIDICVYNHLG